MFNINYRENEILQQLGSRLQEARLTRDESQEVFAQRLGISRQTYSKMEKGQPTVPIGYWLRASNLIDRLDTWQEVLRIQSNLFEQYEERRKEKKRAGRKRKVSS